MKSKAFEVALALISSAETAKNTAEISGKLSKLNETIKAGYTKGEMENLGSFTVGVEGATYVPETPLFSLTIYNGGPQSVFFMVNKQSAIKGQPPLNSGENISISMKNAQIERVYFQTTLGTATLRLFGVK